MLVNQERLNQDDSERSHPQVKDIQGGGAAPELGVITKKTSVFRQKGYPSLCFNYSLRGFLSHRRSPDKSDARIRYLYLHARITEQTSSFKSSYANG